MKTDRTIFLKLNLTDYDDLLLLYGNEKVRKYLGGIVAKDEFDKKFNNFLSAKLPECYWIIREKETCSFVGILSITKHHDQMHYEISYELNPDFWGKGYGTEVVEKGIEFTFSKLGLKELYAETQKNNIQSINLLEKIGMKFVSETERFGEKQLIYSLSSDSLLCSTFILQL